MYIVIYDNIHIVIVIEIHIVIVPKQPKVYFMQPLMVTVRITAVTIWLQTVVRL